MWVFMVDPDGLVYEMGKVCLVSVAKVMGVVNDIGVVVVWDQGVDPDGVGCEFRFK